MKGNNKSFAEHYRVYVTSHTGLLRGNNEDNFTVNSVSKKLEYKNVSFSAVYDAPLLAAVFDGMGGESLGEFASCISARMAKALYQALTGNAETPIDELIADYTQRANDAIRAFLVKTHCETGGSTVAALIIKNEIMYPFSLGDSRLYLMRSGRLQQLSKDHTLAMKKVEANIYTLEAAEKSLDSHKLTAFLGADENGTGLFPETYEPVMLHKSDKLLLCSDGLYDEVPLKAIQEIIKNNPDNPTLELVRAAIKHGGSDNVTCVMVEREI